MENMLVDIVKELVDKPEDVVVTVRNEDNSDAYVLELSVAEEDVGRVIGRNGKIARALRTIIKAASIHNNKRYTLEIL